MSANSFDPTVSGDPLFQEIFTLSGKLTNAMAFRDRELATQGHVDKVTRALIDKICERMAAVRNDNEEAKQ